MKVRKPLNLPQQEMVNHLMEFIIKHNEGLQLEFDMYMMQTCIDSTNKAIEDLNSQGDFPFACDCENEHDKECHLTAVTPYNIVEKHEIAWMSMLSTINALDDGFSFGELLNHHRNLPYNVFKGLLTEAIDKDIITRKDDELFYRSAQWQKQKNHHRFLERLA